MTRRWLCPYHGTCAGCAIARRAARKEVCRRRPKKLPFTKLVGNDQYMRELMTP